MSMSLMQMVGAAGATAPRSAVASSSSSTTTPPSTTTAPGVDLTNTFLQLLSTQLANQSPLDPVDPNQFTVELAQFDSLGELTQIESLMQTLVNDVASPSTPTAGGAAAGATSAPSISNTNSISH